MPRLMKRWILLLSNCFLIFLPLSLSAEWYAASKSIMGTEVSLSFWFPEKKIAQRIEAAVFADMEGIDQRLSPYIESSELAKVNRLAAKETQQLSRELALLIDRSLYYGRETSGAFDITYASLGWHYDYREKKQPDEKLKLELKQAINFRSLKFDRDNRSLSYLHPNLRIDLGGIAKGYAVDRAVKILSDFGVEHASISAGGDSRILGDKRGKPWLIGIKNPRFKNQRDEIAITIPLNDIAVSTSGDYERYFIDPKTGKRVHHIINPKTGESAREVMSVTVLGPLGIDTDPLSTSVFVLGVAKGLALIERLQDFDCIIIDAKGKVHYSAGLMPPEK